MQINARLIVSAETADLSPAEIVERTALDFEEGGFSEIPESDEVWVSDSAVLHTAFSEDIDSIEKKPAFLGLLVNAINDLDDLALGEVPEAEGTISGSLSLTTISRLLAAFRQDQAASQEALESCEPSDEDISPSDYVDYLEQWVKTLEIAERHAALIIISMC